MARSLCFGLGDDVLGDRNVVGFRNVVVGGLTSALLTLRRLYESNFFEPYLLNTSDVV